MSENTIRDKRERLADSLPIECPYLIQVFPVYACNSKCEFCIYSLEKSKHGFMSDCTFIDLNLYKKFVKDMDGHKTKMLRFAGTGEPLLHKNIADMIAISKKAGISDRIDIVTNGLLLNAKLSTDLINAGLDTLRISVNGLSSEDYKKYCNVNMNFENFISEIKYFYENRKSTKVYIKIIDYMIEDETLKDKFYSIFEPICDIIAVENLTKTVECIDFSNLQSDFEKGQNGQNLLDVNICPQPFYMLQVNPDGKIVPCCCMEYPDIVGDINNDGIIDIFKGNKFNTFRKNMLLGNKTDGCEKCEVYKFSVHSEDVLDNDVEKLKGLY